MLSISENFSSNNKIRSAISSGVDEARSIEFLVLILALLLVGVRDLRDRGGVRVGVNERGRVFGRDGMLGNKYGL